MNPTDIPLLILGVPFHAVDNAQTLAWCLEHIRKGRPGYITTPNLDFVMQAGKDPELYRIITESNLVIADGMPIVWLSGFLGPKLPERVAGSDLVLSLSAAAAQNSYSVFNLGGATGVPEKAGEVLTQRFPGFKLAGAYSPPKADLLEMDQDDIIERISKANPDILYVAFGAPKQEKWINMHFRDWKVPLAIGIGASLDFLAEAQTRAPKWMQKSGTEWIWRLGTNPARLWKRYAANLVFLFQSVWKMKKINRKPFDRQPAQLPPEEFTSYFRLIKWTSIDHQGQAQLFIDEACKESNIPNLLIDLSDTPWLNSLELGVLLTLGRWAKKHECQLLVTGLAGRLSAWLNINGLESLFQVLKPEQDWQEFTEMKIGGFTVLSPAYGTLRFIPPPELTATTLPDWKEKIKNILMERSPEIIRIEIEAEHLSFLDSAGLEYLIHLRKEVKMLTLEWELYNLKGAPLTTLKLSRMESLLR